MQQRALAAPGYADRVGPWARLRQGWGPEQEARVGAVQGGGGSGQRKGVVQVGCWGRVVSLEALPAPKEATVVEHVLGGRIQAPVVALARAAGLAGNLDEAVVERQVVADAVLPGGELEAVVREAAADEGADAAKSETLVRTLQDGHGDEGDVGVGGLCWLRGVPRGLRRPPRGPDLSAKLRGVAQAASAHLELAGKGARALPLPLPLRLR